MKRSVNEITNSRRLRRGRRFDWTRRLLAESRLSTDDLIWPVFAAEGKTEAVPFLPGVERLDEEGIARTARMAVELKIPAIAIFPNVALEKRDETGSNILDPDNLANRAIRIARREAPDLGIISDPALDPFTSHGHDGVLRDGIVVNDESVEIIARASILQAEAGADVIAPSDMMDGRIGAIRDALDSSGFEDAAILSYATKFSSSFYGPYREAVSTSALLQGDKKSYYLDPANIDEALREAEQDVAEGADMLMVKPGMPYLDVASRIKRRFSLPTFAYQVSGECAMLSLGAERGFLDEKRAVIESMLCFKRAGCDGIFTYFAPKIARWLLGEE